MREKFYILLKEHFINLESKLNQLDAVIGDGDHGSTLLKGLSAIPNSELPPDKAFKAETGGASGSLFSILIGAILSPPGVIIISFFLSVIFRYLFSK